MAGDDGRTKRYQPHPLPTMRQRKTCPIQTERHSAFTITSNMGFIMICPTITSDPKTPLQAAPQRAIETPVPRNPAAFPSLATPHTDLCSYPYFSLACLNHPLPLFPIPVVYPPALSFESP